MATQQPITIRPPRPESEEIKTNPYLPILEKQRELFSSREFPSLEQRIQALNTLGQAVSAYSDQLVKAVQADFGHRSTFESTATEVVAILGEIKWTKGKIKKWMKPQKPPFASGLPGIKVIHQPKGVIGIMGAWNYPTMLVLSPLIGVLAAGNHGMLKPPDVTPRVSETIKEMISKYFDEAYITTIVGDVQSSIDFSELPFDHVVYTGNTEIGRRVMMAAAKNLTPVTLELGGKSPVIISDGYPIQKAVDRLMMGKSFNAGQTCVAPDYALIAEGRESELVSAFEDVAAQRFPSLVDNDDVTWIVNDRHFERVNNLIEDARQKGASVTQVNPLNEKIPVGQRIIPLTIITHATDDMRVLQEEIFGPVLPVRSVKNTAQALEYVKQRPRPLAFYYFDEDIERGKEVIENCKSGGACVNDVMLHGMNMHMPFGGTGDSGVGAYHGFYGFTEFSHKKTVLVQGNRFSPSTLMKGPYPKSGVKWLNKAAGWLTPK